MPANGNYKGGLSAVILAGGMSARMGFPKLLSAKSGEPVISTMSKNLKASGFGRLAVVISDPRLMPFIDKYLPQAHPIFNPQPERGMISSLRLALNRVEPGEGGILAWAVDHPLVKQSTLSRISRCASDKNIVIPVYRGRRGHPTWWGRTAFELLRSPAADNGAKHVLPELADSVIEIAVEDEYVLADIDTPAEAEQFGLTCYKWDV